MNKDDFLNNNLVNDVDITVEPTNLDAQSVLQILIKFQDFINSKVVHDGKDGLNSLVFTGIMRRTTTNELAVGDTFSLHATGGYFSREPNVGDTFILLATTQVSGGSPSSGNQTLYLYLCEVTEKIDNTVTCYVRNRRAMGGSTLIYNGIYTADSIPESISVSRETFSRLPFPEEFCLIIASINGTNYLLIGKCQNWFLSVPTPETITLTIQQSVAIPNGVNGEDALYYYSYYTTSNPLTDFDNVTLPISNFNRTPKVGDRFTLWTRITSTNTLYYNNMRVQSVTETQATSKMRRQMAITETTATPVYLHQLTISGTSTPQTGSVVFIIYCSIFTKTETPYTDFSQLISDITSLYSLTNFVSFSAFGNANDNSVQCCITGVRFQSSQIVFYYQKYDANNPNKQLFESVGIGSQITISDKVVPF